MSKAASSERRVVITGIGVVSPIGIGCDSFAQSLAAGKSGIARLERLPHTALPGNVGGEVKEFSDSTARKVYLKGQRKSIKVMCREIQLGVASAVLALETSRLDLEQIDHTRLGVDFGANQMFSPSNVLKEACLACVGGADSRFEFDQWGQTGMPRLEPLWLLKYLPNMPACHIGILADAQGPNNSLTCAEAAGNLAMGEAYRVILRGDADLMIAGTTGTRIHEVKCLHAYLWEELADSSDAPEKWCRPFDRNRIGQVAGEAACSFIFEDESHAMGRGAVILGTVLGAGSSCVFGRNGRPGTRQALANAMHAALRDADLSPSDVGHINTHGLGAQTTDVDEAAAIQDVFGDCADQVPVTALKSYVGNSGAACGTLELAGSLVSLRESMVPPTLNFETPDSECRLNVVANNPLRVSNKVVLNVNVSQLGQASALVACGA